jgi:16S rRNA (cytosine1402-N4)-methyltransferase
MSATDTIKTVHVPVLLQEVIELLAIKPDDVVVDCTAGGGGYAEAILGLLGKDGKYVAIDADQDALMRVTARVHDDVRLKCIQGNFRDLERLLAEHNVTHVTKIVADLGFSSDQLAVSGRGFSLDKDEPLLMTYVSEIGPEVLTAWHVVNEWSESSLADVIYGYGGETRARRIAAAIVTEREEKPITTARELAEVVKAVFPKRHMRVHPATKTFQAIRIAVNDELGALDALLGQAIDRLMPKGRAAVVSFHSIEDRTVKHAFRNAVKAGYGILVTDKPLVPTQEEITSNKRARSAKLRVFEKRISVD